jgi:glycosyltransferase involved in cell wall biosynthesis
MPSTSLDRGRRGGETRVLHFGDAWWVAGGGISAVIRRHLARTLPGFRMEAVATVDPSARGVLRRNRHLLGAWRALLALRADGAIAHVHLSQRGSLLREGSVLVAARLLGVRSVVTVHGSSTATQGPVARTATRLVLGQASAVHLLAETHRERLGADRRPWTTFVIANDVAPPDVVRPLDSRTRTVVFGGRVGFRKGVDVLLEAWRAADTDGWTLVLAGPVDDDMAATVSAAQADDPTVIGLGPIAGEDVMEHLTRSQVAVLPSRAEAMPMFLVEALAAGCAVIGTSVGGVPDLLERGRSGLLVEPGDVAGLTAALETLLHDHALRVSLGQAGRRQVVEQSTDASRHWSTTYRSLATGAPEPVSEGR